MNSIVEQFQPCNLKYFQKNLPLSIFNVTCVCEQRWCEMFELDELVELFLFEKTHFLQQYYCFVFFKDMSSIKR